ncbi:unnamed protein product [Symbiodinium microadriaticum]|nr:unnamed protein product [Symbiodinium microadriaticum]
MILAFQLALCGLVQAIDEECLLARPTRTGTLEEDLGGEEDTGLDYKGPLHRLSHFVGLAVRAASDPSRVKLIPTLLSQFWFWPSGDPKEALVSTILQWTQHYVNSGPIKDLNDQVSSHLNAVKVWLEHYLDDQRPTVWDLKEARAEAQKALQDIKDSQVKAGGIANFLLAAGGLMAMWREEYNLYGTKDIVDAFWTWRLEFIEYDWAGGLEWNDHLIGAKRKYRTSYRKAVQYVASFVLEREIFVHELAPMLKSFTTLHRLIPGREKDPAEVPLPRDEHELQQLHLDGWGPHGRRCGPFGISHKGHSFITKIGNENGGSKKQERDLPLYTCGVEIAYHEYSMNGIAFMNIKNQSLAIQGYDEERGMDSKRMYTGPGLCGLYTLHQFDKYNSPRKIHASWTLGDGSLLSFKWEPVPEEDFSDALHGERLAGGPPAKAQVVTGDFQLELRMGKLLYGAKSRDSIQIYDMYKSWGKPRRVVYGSVNEHYDVWMRRGTRRELLWDVHPKRALALPMLLEGMNTLACPRLHVRGVRLRLPESALLWLLICAPLPRLFLSYGLGGIVLLANWLAEPQLVVGRLRMKRQALSVLHCRRHWCGDPDYYVILHWLLDSPRSPVLPAGDAASVSVDGALGMDGCDDAESVVEESEEEGTP